MNDIWADIKLWLSENIPLLLSRLAPAADETAIAKAEESLGVEFPTVFRQSTKIHDGETEDEAWLFGSHSLLPLTSIVHFWKQERELAAKVQTDDWDLSHVPAEIGGAPWNPRWVPFAHDGSGGYLHMDLGPTAEGQSGQVIQTTSDGDYRLVAPSLESFLVTYCQHLQRGSFEVYEDSLEPVSGDDHWWEDR